MTAVCLRGVAVAYDGAVVVSNVTIEVAPGDWLGIIGANGVGKSTLLKAIAGTVGFSGNITFGGSGRPRTRKESARTVAHVPQQPILPLGMRVVDYVLLGRTPHIGMLSMESAHDVEVVAATLAALHVEGLASRQIETLSGGETQRVILARALAQEAAVLLLDEPTASLDIGRQVEVFRLIDRLRRERDLAVISAIHDLTLAARFCDRVALMHGGGIVAQGEPGDVITEANLRAHFGADIRVLADPEVGIVVVPGDGGDDKAAEMPPSPPDSLDP